MLKGAKSEAKSKALGAYRGGVNQLHLAQDHYLKKALIVNGVHESKIRFTCQLGVKYLALWGE